MDGRCHGAPRLSSIRELLQARFHGRRRTAGPDQTALLYAFGWPPAPSHLPQVRSMQNHLAELRKSRGLSAAEIAELAGLTRQAIYAIEAGAYMPNTAVALRLARILGTNVEAMFSLEDEPEQVLTTEFEALDPESPPAPGEPIQICRIGRSNIGVSASTSPAWLPMADGIVDKPRRALLASPVEVENRVLIAGCDPALSLLSAHALKAGVEVVLASANSARSLELLRAGKAHVAGIHPGIDAAESGFA